VADSASSSSGGERQQIAVLGTSLLPPAVEVRAGHDVRGDPPVVEAEERLVVDEDVAAPGAVLEVLDVVEQVAVGLEERVVVRQSPSTSACRMNRSRDSSGSIRPYCTLRPATIGTP
jgi:hypothetical protein